MNNKNNILSTELNRLKEIRDNNHWASVRHEENFKQSLISTPTGNRVIWLPKNDMHNKDLQSSRSVGLQNVETIDDLELSYEKGMKLTHTDEIRAYEIDEIIDTHNKFLHLQKKHTHFKVSGMCEIGFRYPRLMNYYSNLYDIPVIGYDVSTLAVEFGKSKSFNVKECDLNNLDAKEIKLSDSNIICMYHVLEHVKNPITTLRYIRNLMPINGLIHIEVPIEMDKPQVEFGHLFGFHPGDLARYCSFVGLSIISLITKNIAGAIVHERVGCIRRE
jgi:hypothetical protein